MNRFVGSMKDTNGLGRMKETLEEPIKFDCNQYPVRKLIAVGDRIEVIYLYKIQKYNLPSTV